MPLVDIRGVQVNFPFEPYPCQITYMSKVLECLQQNVHGVLESPTGTGKTLCLLCSTLAWLQDKKAQVELNRQMGVAAALRNKENLGEGTLGRLASSLQQATGASWGTDEFAVPKIIYASRTHSQLSQAVQELKRTAYTSIKSCVLGSREQLCIHEQVKKETSNTAKVHMCRAKVASRRCHYYNVFDDFKKKGEARQIVGGIVDIEDLVKNGEKNKQCPYYMARELKTDADIIFMPYNYLLDAKSRRAHGVELQGNIVIFDEAHNLEKICEESASIDLASTDIATAMEEVAKLTDTIVELADTEQRNFDGGESASLEPEFTLDDLLRLKSILKQLEEAVDAIHLPSNEGITRPGMFMFELLASVSITFETKGVILDVLEKMITFLTNEGMGKSLHTKGAGLSKFADVLKTVFSQEVGDGRSIIQHQATLTKSYKVHIHKKDSGAKKRKIDSWAGAGGADKEERILSYWCFSPGHSMRELCAHGVKAIILTSGTLAPLDSFTMEMQIPFPVHLENPHVIQSHQVWVGVLRKGPDNVTLNSSYRTRFDVRYQASLGNSIVNFARITPHGLLIFFPSYPVMNKCIEYWQEQNIWQRISQHKTVFVELKGKTAFNDAIDEFYEKVNDPSLNGAIFMAVCRGKVSEGLDFADNNGRAVIITGLPYPPRMDPRVMLKMQFLQELHARSKDKTLSGEEWYRQQASRAVNQAIGRVIRHKDDFGAILLCDDRFASASSIGQLPVWVKPRVKTYDKFGLHIRDLTAFFRNAESLLPAPQTRRRGGRAGQSGCQGATFLPTTSVRSGTRPPAPVQPASLVDTHMPSLKEPQEDMAMPLQLQYQAGGLQSKAQGSGARGLLGALDRVEKRLGEVSSPPEFQVPSVKPPSKVSSKKKKFILKRPTENPFSTPDPQESSKVKQGSTAPPSSAHLSAQNYLAQVKEVLAGEAYKAFSLALREYKAAEDLTKVAAVMVDLFTSTEENFPLLRNFYKFVRPKHKKEFDQICREITGQGCGFKPEDALSCKPSLPPQRQPESRSKLGSLPAPLGTLQGARPSADPAGPLSSLPSSTSVSTGHRGSESSWSEQPPLTSSVGAGETGGAGREVAPSRHEDVAKTCCQIPSTATVASARSASRTVAVPGSAREGCLPESLAPGPSTSSGGGGVQRNPARTLSQTSLDGTRSRCLPRLPDGALRKKPHNEEAKADIEGDDGEGVEGYPEWLTDRERADGADLIRVPATLDRERKGKGSNSLVTYSERGQALS